MIVVTGGSGFIGGAVCDEIRSRGGQPVSFDRVEGHDIREPFDLPDGCEAVIHLAGVLGTHELWDDIDLAIDTNIRGTVNVLSAIVRHGKRVPYVGITMPQVFPSIYTATKIGAGAFEWAFRNEYRIPVAKVRAFNAYGPGQAFDLDPTVARVVGFHDGWVQHHPQKIIPAFAGLAWAGLPLPVWGDGDQGVDLVSAATLARMLVDAVGFASVEDDVTIDGGTGRQWTVMEVAEFVNAHTGNEAGIVHLPMRRGEVPTSIVAAGEGWDLLDWTPDGGSVDELAQTIDFYKTAIPF